MASDIQILVIALILSGMIYGSISGYSIYCGDNQDRQPMSQFMKLLLLVFFPFTLAAIGSAKVVIWWLGWISYDGGDSL